MNTLRVDQQSINEQRCILQKAIVKLSIRHLKGQMSNQQFDAVCSEIDVDREYLFKLERCL